MNNLKKNLKNYFINNKAFVIVLSICVLFTSLIMAFIAKNNKSSVNVDIKVEDTSLRQFETYTVELSTINTSLKDCVNGYSINSKEATNILNNGISSLDALKSHVSSMVIINNSNPELIPKFLSAIEETSKLYNYCIEVLTYNTALNTAEVTSEILLLKENCVESYNELSPYGLTIDFPEDSSLFLDNLSSYLNTLDRLSKEQSIKTSQFSDYMNILSNTASIFSPLLEDLEPAITQIRNDNRSLDIILEDIKAKEDSLASIKTDFSYSSIPEGCLSYYNCFNNVFKLYSTYLSTLKLAVIYEKSAPNYEDHQESIDSNYSNAFSKFDDVKVSFNALVNSIE